MRLGAYADLDEYALLHQAARWARGESVAEDPRPGDGRVRPDDCRAPGAGSSCAGRRGGPWTRCAPRTRATPIPQALVDRLGTNEPGRVAIDLAIVDARPAEATATDSLLAIEGRDGRPARTGQ